MFAVVHYEQHPAGPKGIHQRIRGIARGGQGYAQSGSDCMGHGLRCAQPGELDDPGPIRERRCHGLGQAHSETTLAHPSYPHQGHHPCSREQADEPGDVVFSAHERGDGRREVAVGRR